MSARLGRLGSASDRRSSSRSGTVSSGLAASCCWPLQTGSPRRKRPWSCSRPRWTVAACASTRDKAVAEAASTADEVSTTDEAMATLVSTAAVAEVAASADAAAEEADSAGLQVDAHTTGGGSVGTRTCQCVNHRRPCTHMQVFTFLFLYLYSNAISLLAQTQATEIRRAEDSHRPLGLRTSTRGRGRC